MTILNGRREDRVAREATLLSDGMYPSERGDRKIPSVEFLDLGVIPACQTGADEEPKTERGSRDVSRCDRKEGEEPLRSEGVWSVGNTYEERDGGLYKTGVVNFRRLGSLELGSEWRSTFERSWGTTPVQGDGTPKSPGEPS